MIELEESIKQARKTLGNHVVSDPLPARAHGLADNAFLDARYRDRAGDGLPGVRDR